MINTTLLFAAPETAERIGNLKIVREEYIARNGSKPAVRIWSGRAIKPYVNSYFNSVENREAFIKKQLEADAARTEQKNKEKLEEAQGKAEALELLTINTLLHYSWGWDQTNCEFYQVIERRGTSVVIREIAGQTIEGSEGFRSC